MEKRDIEKVEIQRARKLRTNAKKKRRNLR